MRLLQPCHIDLCLFPYRVNCLGYFTTFGSPMPTRTWSDPNAKYKYGFNGKEIDKGDEGMGGGGSTYDYGFRIYNSNLGRFLSVDPLTRKFAMLTPYQFASNMPVAAIDLDGLEAYIVVFPDYKIATPLGKIGGLGHAGSLIIDPSSGEAYYVEYGRYDSEGKGVARTINDVHKVGTVKFGEDGLPTEESLSQVFSVLSKEAGHDGRIEAAEVPLNQDEFTKAKDIHQKKLAENDNPDREPYKLQENNCGTFSCDVVKESKENSNIPEETSPRPVKMIREVINSGATRVGYDPKTDKTTRGGEYIPSKDEKATDKKEEEQKNGG